MEGQPFFTIEQANGAVREIALIFDRIVGVGEKVRDLTTDINGLLSIWGEDVLDAGHTDHALYAGHVQRRDVFAAEITRLAGEIAAKGAVVKDVESGLVDFPCRRGSEVIMLCWKYGEADISYWHTVQGGYAGRRHIDELKAPPPQI